MLIDITTESLLLETVWTEFQVGGLMDVERLVVCHHEELVGLAEQWLGDPAAAQDCVQDAWVAVLRKGTHFKGLSSPRTWLYRIVRNRVLSELRAEGRRRKFHEKYAPLQKRSSSYPRLPNPFLRRRCESALSSLPAKKREIFVRHVFEGETLAEIAEENNVHPGTCRSQFYKARLQLHATLLDSLVGGQGG